MALVTTSLVTPGIIDTWGSPGDLTRTSMPFGECVWAGSDTVPALINNDESQFNWTCNFPRNYVYRITDVVFNCFSDTKVAGGGLTHQEGGVRAILSSDKPGFTDYSFLLYATDQFINDTSFQEAVAIAAAGVSNDNLRPYHLGGLNGLSKPPRTLIDASTAAARVFFTLMNVSTDDTDEVFIQVRMTADMFTVEQAQHAWVHHQIPVY